MSELEFNRKGSDVKVAPLVFTIIAVVVLVILIISLVTHSGYFYEFFGGFGFNNTRSVVETPLIVGLSLTEEDGFKIGAFKYYTGSKWLSIEEPNVKLGKKEINAQGMLDIFRKFYTETERIGDPYFDLPYTPGSYRSKPIYRRLVAVDFIAKKLPVADDDGGNYFASVHEELKPPYVGDPAIKKYLVDLEGDLYVNEDSGARWEKADIVKYPIVVYADALVKYINYRDQILEGHLAEKFITLSFKDEGSDVTNRYKVKKEDEILAVNLDDPVSKGLRDDYSRFTPVKYDDRSKWKNGATVKISFTPLMVLRGIPGSGVFELKNRIKAIFWDPLEKGWYAETIEIPATEETEKIESEVFKTTVLRADDFQMTPSEQKDFYFGLKKTVEALDQEGFFDYENVGVEIILGNKLVDALQAGGDNRQVEELIPEERQETIDWVLDNYNPLFAP